MRESGEKASQYLIGKYDPNSAGVGIVPLETDYSQNTLSTQITEAGTYFVIDSEALNKVMRIKYSKEALQFCI